MKVFISWSGDDSRLVAEALRAWLPTVLAGTVECFVSSQDIRRGDRGMDVIAGELQDRDFGIVVLTKENMASPWINFEAGALGKSLGVGKVAPLLLGITRADVEGPISQFQNTLLSDREDMRRFVRDIATLSPGVPEESVATLFGAKWAELEAVIAQASGMAGPKTTRSTESILEEVLGHVRALRQSQQATAAGKLEEDLRQQRLRLLDKRHGGRVYRDGNGNFVDALDYDAQGDKVLVILGANGIREWVEAADISLTPF